ncbi:sugar phosphate isomerase/epimerase family protein [Candidatus Pseudothioglobus sp. Uisw_050_01]|uniref:sugar phosphate isomerase/epimerase family protein n=1 Tax=Candidatus Pseudothioglobus sp. Uisw_050_01 TaxID=3230997 RepID=UPI003A8BADC8
MSFKFNDVYISIYSFGYSAGFISDSRRGDEFNIITPARMIKICHQYGYSGIELPVDRYFPTFDKIEITSFIDNIYKNNLGIKIDFENISAEYSKNIIPILANYGIKYFRVKVSNFYGCNRYRHPEFESDFELFSQYVDEILPFLKEFGIQLLIENHQDIIVDDYHRLWNRFPKEYIGVNWDTGNSLPALESPNNFLNTMYPYIGNIHLKDYKIYKTDLGYKLSRCPLGQGVVNFSDILSFFKEKKIEIPVTIELGALNSRNSDIYVDDFWNALPEVSDFRKQNFIKYIESNYQTQIEIKSTWENKQSPESIYLSELNDMELSVKYLNGLEI